MHAAAVAGILYSIAIRMHILLYIVAIIIPTVYYYYMVCCSICKKTIFFSLQGEWESLIASLRNIKIKRRGRTTITRL